MTFDPLSRAPLVVYPPVDDICPDFGFSQFLSGGEYWVPAGPCTGVLVTGEGETINKSVRWNFTGQNQGYVQWGPRPTSPSIVPGATYTFYWYFRTKMKAYTSGTDSFQGRLDYYTSGNAFISSASVVQPFAANAIPADNNWRVYRASFTTTVPSNAARCGGYCGWGTVAAKTFDHYLDWAFCSAVLDFSDLGPLGDGARFLSGHLPVREKNPTAQGAIPNGVVETNVFPGWIPGEVEIGPMDDAAVAKYKAFIDSVRGNAPDKIQSWIQRRDYLAEHYLRRVANVNTSYGLRKVRDYWRAVARLRTVP